MRLLVVLLACLSPNLCLAQSKDVTLEGTFEKWDGATKGEMPGLSVMPPESLHFSARYLEAPKACSIGLLKTILAMNGREAFLKKVPVSHCVLLATKAGRQTPAFVEDLLVPGLNSDAKVGGTLDIHANLLGYEVKADRSRNTPVLMINAFEPE